MKLVCDKVALNDALSLTNRAIASRTTMPILEGIYLETTPNGLRLFSTDMNKAIDTYIDAMVSEEGNIVVPGRLFSEMVRKLPDGQVQIHSDGTTIHLYCNNSKTSIQSMAADEYPTIQEIEERDPIRIASATLKNLIASTSFAISTEDTRVVLTGGFLKVQDENATMVGLDGYRLALYNSKIEPVETPVSAIIPGAPLNELGRILPDTKDEIRLTVTPTHFMATMGKTKFISRLLEGDYFNYEQIIPSAWDSRVRVNSGELGRAIDRASTIARGERNNLITMSIQDDCMAITSNTDIGNAYETLPIGLEGNDIQIAFNARYLLDVVRSLNGEDVYICFTTNISPCVVMPVEGNAFKYLVLPVRIYAQ